jgi:hypothetical protein
VKLDAEILSLVTNVGTVILLLYFIKSAKEVALRWLDLLSLNQGSDPLGPTEIRYHGGRLRQTHPILLTTPHALSAEDRTIHPQEDSTGWNTVVKMWNGVVRARETT